MPARTVRSALALAAAIVGIVGLASTARAQVNTTEPPDLSNNFVTPTSVGTVALGLNTIHGTILGSVSGATVGGDHTDATSFIVPAGLVVTRVEIVITNFSRTGLVTAHTKSLDFALQNSFDFSGNGTNASMIATLNQALAPGTYTLGVELLHPGPTGTASFTWEYHITGAVNTNDTCNVATPIGLGATPFNNSTATTDGLAHGACDFSGSPSIARDLWYTFTPTMDGLLTVSTCGSSFDTEINVYSDGAAACPGLETTLLACNDDSNACGASSQQSLVALTVLAGVPYLIRVGSSDGGSQIGGPGTLTLSELTSGACCNRWNGTCVEERQADCISHGLRFDGWGSTCLPTTCKACPADFNGTGGLGVQDIFDFLGAWFAGCP